MSGAEVKYCMLSGLMYQKTCTVERHYSKAQVERIIELLYSLQKARGSKSVEAYTKKVLARIKA